MIKGMNVHPQLSRPAAAQNNAIDPNIADPDQDGSENDSDDDDFVYVLDVSDDEE